MGQCMSRKAAGALAATASASSAPYRAMEQPSPAIKKKGQGESKGATKRSTPYTRGTAMSFGFKKRSHTAIPTSTTEKGGTVIANPKANLTDNSRPNSALTDNNGNSGSLDSLTATSPEPSGRSTPRLAPPRKEAAGAPLRTNRFGFRQGNSGRPALTAKVSDVSVPQPQVANQSQANNNLEKPRPKTCGQINIQTSNNQQSIQPKIKPSVPVQNTQTAPVVDRNKVVYSKPPINTNAYMPPPAQTQTPTPMPVPLSLPMQAGKFTLHTSSLPRPQFAVRVMESKVAKQAVNNSRKVNTAMQTGEAGYGMKESSDDSGTGSCNGPDNNDMVPTIDQLEGSPRRVRYRPRNLEMVMRGNHNFEVRDLDESLSDETILPLPKLPSSFSNTGLVRDRASELQQRNQQTAESCIIPRKTSTTSCDSFQDDSCDEEKAFRDRSSTEKEMHISTSKDFSPSSKGSSPASSKASSGGRSTAWGHGGESMALRDEYSLSFSSSDESKDKEPLTPMTPMMATSLTMNTGLQNLMTSSLGGGGNKQPIRNVLLTIEDPKFAAVAAAASAQSLLDDETSPVDSLISSCTDSDELISKKKKNDDTSKEKDSMEILDNVPPISPGTPTNASNSLSLSDGRDFLIDDEIADQPALVFDDKKSSSADQLTSSLQLLSFTDNTITLIDSTTTPAPSLNNRPVRSFAVNNNSATGSPAPLRAKNPYLSRTGSLDTLSPCESIASDDLMMDFDHSQSSIDSDRLDGMASGSALHSLDEATIRSELEAQGGQVMKEWSSLLGTHKPRVRESIGAQLPARATRLLNRSRASPPEAPRSLDSVGSHIHPVRRTPTLRPPRQGVSDSPDDAIRLDRAAHGSMVQDIVGIKTMLLKLKRVLQETETLNPFDNQHSLKNGLFYQGESDGSNAGNSGDDQANEADTASRQELADLRRQVVFLQSQLEDKERTVQLLQLQMTKYSSTQSGSSNGVHSTSVSSSEESEPPVCHAATQTERLRPVSAGPSVLQHALPDNTNGILSWSKMHKVRTPGLPPSDTIRTIPILATPGAPIPSSTVLKRTTFWNIRDQNIMKNNTNQSPAIIKQSTEQTLDKRKLIPNGTTTNIVHNNNLKNIDPNSKYKTNTSIKLQNGITSNNENNIVNGHKSLPHFLNTQNGSK